MEKNKKELEKYLRKLQEIEKQIDGGSDDSELFNEVNKIIDGLTNVAQEDITKNSVGAKLKFINQSENPDPSFSKEGDSGFDIRASIPFAVHIPVGKIKLIPTGLYFEVDKGLEIQIRSRSGLAANKGVFVLNSPGTIDSGYRGEIKIILANFGDFPLSVENGDRIAQGVVCPVYGEGNLSMMKVNKLSNSERNEGGFGHTGIE